MKYRDNVVEFKGVGGYSIVSGSYRIDSFSVTNGQDPEDRIYAGKTVTCGKDGEFTFSVGRKGSSTVADWFNDRIPAEQNTFNHTAGKLNFAFIGRLELTLTGGDLEDRQETFSFDDIALAQGHTGAANNWWFGGKNCLFIPFDSVQCPAQSTSGDFTLFSFRRGDNGVNVVSLFPEWIPDAQRWMKRLPSSLRLDQIVMPGSHNTGMSELHHCAPPFVADRFTKTQDRPIAAQLAAGCRYFDIRVDYDKNELVTYHRTGQWGCNGQDLKAVLDQARLFVASRPSETAILVFSHIRNFMEHEPADIKRRIEAFLDNYSDFIYTNDSEGVNLAELTLGEVRGKMILVFDYEEHISTATGRFRYKDGKAAQSGVNLTVYNQYSNTADLQRMQADQLAKWDRYGGLGQGFLFLLSWTLTPDISNPSSVEDLAERANAELADVLHSRIVMQKAPKPNVVYLDFLDNMLAQTIVQYNFI